VTNRRARTAAELLARFLEPPPIRYAPNPVEDFPSEFGRVDLVGTAIAPASITTGNLATAMNKVLADQDAITLFHVGNLMRASDVTRLPADFYSGLTIELVDHFKRVAPTPAEGLDWVLGRRKVGKRMLSLDERAMRAGKGLMTMVSEMVAHGHDPAILFDPRWYDLTADFVRAYIMRGGYEHGLRFELRTTLTIETALATAARRFRYQRRIPGLDGRKLQSGPDAILHAAGLAYLIQLKAFREFGSLFSGKVGLTRKAGLITEVTGPAIPKQIVADLLRLMPWGFRVPGATLDYNLAAAPASFSGWDEVADTMVFIIDDEYLLNGVMATISQAMRSPAAVVVNGELLLDLTKVDWEPAVTNRIRETFIDLVEGDRLNVHEAAELWDSGKAHVQALLRGFEVDISRYLGHPDVFALFNRRQHVKLLSSTDGPEAILSTLGLPP
jgi:hypothetical protein